MNDSWGKQRTIKSVIPPNEPSSQSLRSNTNGLLVSAIAASCLLIGASFLPSSFWAESAQAQFQPFLNAAPANGLPEAPAVYLSTSPDVDALRLSIDQLVEEDRLTEAASRLQDLAANYRDKVIETLPDRDSYVQVTVWVEDYLRSHPELLRVYRRDFGGWAERALQDVFANDYGWMMRTGSEANDGGEERRDADGFAALSLAAKRRVALTEIATLYGVTHAGQAARLSLAGYALETGNLAEAEAALKRLADFIDDAEQQAMYRELKRALASMRSVQAARSIQAKRSVSAVYDQSSRDQTEQSSLAPNSNLRLVDIFDAPNWEHQVADLVGLNTQQAARLPANALNQQQLILQRQNQLRRGQGAQSEAVIDQHRVLINTDLNLMALDRTSGELIWSLARNELPKEGQEEAEVVRRNLGFGFGRNTTGRDIRRPVVIDDMVIGLLGTNGITRGRNPGFDTSVRLVAVEQETGALRWQASPEDLGDGLSKAYFHGPVTYLGDSLILPLTQQQGDQHDLYIAAFDRRTGQPIWHRHLSSHILQNRVSAMIAPRVMAAAGRIFAVDNLSTVAQLDPINGQVVWLHKIKLEENAQQLEGAAGERAGEQIGEQLDPADFAAAMRERERRQRLALARQASAGGLSHTQAAMPVQTPAGLLVYNSRGLGWQLRDIKTGAFIRALQHDVWTMATQVLALPSTASADLSDEVQADFLVLGDQVARVDGETLAIKAGSDGAIHRRVPIQETTGGLAKVIHKAGRDVLLTSGEGGVVAMDVSLPADAKTAAGAFGTVIERVQLSETNAIDFERGQLLISRLGMVHSYMPWALAEGELQQRIADGPTNPEPGLALAQQGIRQGQFEAAIVGLDAALDALDERRMTMVSGDGDQIEGQIEDQNEEQDQAVLALERRVFDRMLAMATSPQVSSGELNVIDATTALKRQIFDRVARAAPGPKEQVAYHLAAGHFYESIENIEQAIGHYQSILEAPTLSESSEIALGAGHSAAIDATVRVRELVATHGRALYQTYETALAREVTRITSKTNWSGQELVALTYRYPAAQGLAAIYLQAAEREWRSGAEWPRAADYFRQAYRYAAKPSTKQRAVEALAEVYLVEEQNQYARAWLRHVAAEYPQMTMNLSRSVFSNNAALNQSDLLGFIADLNHGGMGAPESGSVEVAIHDLIDALAFEAITQTERPDLSRPFARVELQGARLLVPTFDDPLELKRNGFLVLVGNSLQRQDAQTLEVQWQTNLVHRNDTEVLIHNDEQILLWSQSQQSIIGLDAMTGHVKWPAVNIGEVFAMMAADPRELPDQAEEQADGRDQADGREQAGEAIVDGVQIDIRLNGQRIRAADMRLNPNGGIRILQQNLPIDVEGLDRNEALQLQEEVNQRLPRNTPQMHVQVGAMVVCFVHPNGHMVGLDRLSGRVLWQRTLDLTRVTASLRDHDRLVLGGYRQDDIELWSDADRMLRREQFENQQLQNQRAQNQLAPNQRALNQRALNQQRFNPNERVKSIVGRLVAVDLYTGEAMTESWATPWVPGWLAMSGERLVVAGHQGRFRQAGSTMGMGLYDLSDWSKVNAGKAEWRQQWAGSSWLGSGWADDKTIVGINDRSALFVIDAATGEKLFEPAVGGVPMINSVRRPNTNHIHNAADGHWYFMGQRQLFGLNRNLEIASGMQSSDLWVSSLPVDNRMVHLRVIDGADDLLVLGQYTNHDPLLKAGPAIEMVENQNWGRAQARRNGLAIFRYERDTGRLLGTQFLPFQNRLSHPVAVEVFEDRLIIGAHHQTLMFEFAKDDD